mmetsp:Transcript_12313/g.36124  ORF Transcript_12313/g.36124 Transcript_12313/m.36124 type:complete len:134 (+) Transcript_12313:315-716(+)
MSIDQGHHNKPPQSHDGASLPHTCARSQRSVPLGLSNTTELSPVKNAHPTSRVPRSSRLFVHCQLSNVDPWMRVGSAGHVSQASNQPSSGWHVRQAAKQRLAHQASSQAAPRTSAEQHAEVVRLDNAVRAAGC